MACLQRHETLQKSMCWINQKHICVRVCNMADHHRWSCNIYIFCAYLVPALWKTHSSSYSIWFRFCIIFRLYFILFCTSLMCIYSKYMPFDLVYFCCMLYEIQFMRSNSTEMMLATSYFIQYLQFAKMFPAQNTLVYAKAHSHKLNSLELRNLGQCFRNSDEFSVHYFVCVCVCVCVYIKFICFA